MCEDVMTAVLKSPNPLYIPKSVGLNTNVQASVSNELPVSCEAINLLMSPWGASQMSQVKIGSSLSPRM